MHWIDVCPRNGNLVATGSNDGSIKIFDRREFNIVKTLNSIHSSKNFDPFLLEHGTTSLLLGFYVFRFCKFLKKLFAF